MKAHSFEVKDAEKHGVNKAILLNHLKFHMNSNIRDERFHKHGKIWCYAKLESLEKMYPYFTKPSISRWLNELEEEGVIESKKPNKSQGRHLKYYHVKGYKGMSQNEKSVETPGTQDIPQKEANKLNEGISQNEKSKFQSETSGGSQNETSSIVTNNNFTVKESDGSVVEKVDSAESYKDLIPIWTSYLRDKGKKVNSYTLDTLNHSWGKKNLDELKRSMLHAIEHDWMRLVDPLEGQSKPRDRPEGVRPDAVMLDQHIPGKVVSN